MERCWLSRSITSTLVAAGPLSSLTAASNSSGLPPVATRHWTADNGNGTYSNPLFYEEFEDPDVIRVGEDYDLAGTTMHMNPAVQLMQSKDLVNWELAGYCMDRLDLGPAFRLEGGNIYGRGIWAPCIRHHQGMFYVFSNVNGVGLQVFRSRSIKGPWERNQLPGRHDLSVLFDDDGKIYVISGGGSPYPIEELTPDLKAFVPGSRRELVGRMGERHHLYKINGRYVDVSACIRAASLIPRRANGGASSSRITPAPAAWCRWFPSPGTTTSRSSGCRATLTPTKPSSVGAPMAGNSRPRADLSPCGSS